MSQIMKIIDERVKEKEKKNKKTERNKGVTQAIVNV